MADQTITASLAASNIPVKKHCPGVNVIVSNYSLTRTVSASDKIFMCKLPRGARVLQVDLTTDNIFYDAGILNVGTPASPTLFISSATVSAGIIFRSKSVNVVDASLTATQGFTYVQVSCSTAKTGTATGVISLMVMYDFDNTVAASGGG